MARPSWSGFLRFNLISVPVRGYNAANSGGGTIGFHLLHASCHSRIRYKKVCPIHGEVPNNEIVSGYEVSKGEYVPVDQQEKAGLKAEDEKTISVDAFLHSATVDPLYFNGRNYFLVPDGKVAQKPYGLLMEAMKKGDRFAVAKVVFAGRARVAVVRPTSGVLTMSLLAFQDEVKKPADFADEVDSADLTAEERKLAETLIEAATVEEFDLGEYKDEYQERLAKLVEAKTRSVKKKPGRASEEPAVINLMDALRKSIDRTKKGHGTNGHPRRKATHEPRRRKTG